MAEIIALWFVSEAEVQTVVNDVHPEEPSGCDCGCEVHEDDKPQE